jgi:MoaA/NifB/PqqE/SkfB family radical SAM enzyme
MTPAWVRLTRLCNNRCLFCLDADSHDGSYLSAGEVQEQMAAGRRRGATRLVLSGGEPTIHPSFLDFVALARRLGYTHVQTVTNGRRFAYKAFLHRALEAGLGEITFSIHGDTPALHDRLVGVEGAFAQTLRGLELALGDGRAIVSVDVCVNRQNVAALPALLEGLGERGVREFDLLRAIPFGGAWSRAAELLLDLDATRAPIEAALELAARRHLTVWFNRFPAWFFEGREELMQEPQKLLDEVRGRYLEFQALLTAGVPLPCQEAERCKQCSVERFCRQLARWRDLEQAGLFAGVRLSAGQKRAALALADARQLWVRADGLEAAAECWRGHAAAGVILDLESYDGLEAALRRGALVDKRLLRCYVATPAALEAALACPGDFEIRAYLGQEMAAHLLERGAPSPRLSLAYRQQASLPAATSFDAELVDFFARYHHGVPVEGVPACISGRAPLSKEPMLDADMLASVAAEQEVTPGGDPASPLWGRPVGGGSLLSPLGCAAAFLREHDLTKSSRCAACAEGASCVGMHINYVRARGYRTLRPLAACLDEERGRR